MLHLFDSSSITYFEVPRLEGEVGRCFDNLTCTQALSLTKYIDFCLMPSPISRLVFENIPPLDFIVPGFSSFSAMFSLNYPVDNKHQESDILASMAIINWQVAVMCCIQILVFGWLIAWFTGIIRKASPKGKVDKIKSSKAIYQLARVYANQLDFTMSSDSTFMKA